MQRAFVEAAQILRQGGIETPELDARLLLCHAASLSHEAFIARAREDLRPDAAALLEGAIARRLKREPVARIRGTREFYGRSFLLGPESLDPRPDTETLIDAALDIIGKKGWREEPLKLLDLGTGSGSILVTLLAELPRATGIGTDLSPRALAVAAANASAHGLASRAVFIAADWLDAIAGKFDLILSNPPYLAASEIAGLAADVAAYDPRLALDGGPDGLDSYRRIAARAREVLAGDGRLLVEIGPAQAEAVAAIFAGAGLRPDEAGSPRLDLAGRSRVVVARR
ncbi:MAG TPA: peptide chain release factor N(5)-glutamine methyltransferase [Methyloceanibacter sp.]|jgi:release factor glutamine methyltransferase|nr:peptide chain release factor N(5)-glutamine methyltransferase [Methyloceanibacter sp.]